MEEKKEKTWEERSREGRGEGKEHLSSMSLDKLSSVDQFSDSIAFGYVLSLRIFLYITHM